MSKSLERLQVRDVLVVPKHSAAAHPHQGSISYDAEKNKILIGNGSEWKTINGEKPLRLSHTAGGGSDQCVPCLCQVYINPAMQPVWKVNEYDTVNDVPKPKKGPFVLKNYVYNSDMAVNSQIFKISSNYNWDATYKNYSLHNTLVNFFTPSTTCPVGTPGNVVPAPGVPGPFSYAMDWNSWGGDDKLEIGKLFYTNILAHFGHTHILSVHAKIAADLNCPAALTPSQDTMMAHLLNGSTQIFRWYAQLVDYPNGNSVNYSVQAGLIPLMKGFMDMLITGAGVGANSGVCPPDNAMDINQIIGLLLFFKQRLNDPNATAIVDSTIPFLMNLLRRNANQQNPIPYLPWYDLMRTHQMVVHHVYDEARELYTTNPDTLGWDEMAADVDMMIMQAIDSGRQMAAFFSLFYAATALLDILVTQAQPLLPPAAKTSPAIPANYAVERVSFIQKAQERWWYEHTNMFVDYDRAAAANDQDSMYKIQLTMLESCTFVACTVGEIFRAFDTIVRHRGLFNVLAQIPPPPQPDMAKFKFVEYQAEINKLPQADKK